MSCKKLHSLGSSILRGATAAAGGFWQLKQQGLEGVDSVGWVGGQQQCLLWSLLSGWLGCCADCVSRMGE